MKSRTILQAFRRWLGDLGALGATLVLGPLAAAWIVLMVQAISHQWAAIAAAVVGVVILALPALADR